MVTSGKSQMLSDSVDFALQVEFTDMTTNFFSGPLNTVRDLLVVLLWHKRRRTVQRYRFADLRNLMADTDRELWAETVRTSSSKEEML